MRGHFTIAGEAKRDKGNGKDKASANGAITR